MTTDRRQSRRPLVQLLSFTVAAPAMFCGAPQIAHAQTDTSALIETAIPDNFDRGRNVSVLERARPDYDPLSIPLGGFKVYPRVEIDQGATSNVFLTSTSKKSDIYTLLLPSVRMTSDWSRHQVLFQANAGLRRFYNNSRRDESAFDVRSLGKLDLTDAIAITGEGQFARLYETPDTGAIDPNLAVLSSYQRSLLGVRGEYALGQARVVLSADRTGFTFNNIKLPAGVRVDQGDRDRIINRVTGQLQYAFTPSLSIYGQTSYSDTNYSRLLRTGLANRDSNSVRAIAGVNFDLAGFLRGKIGVGYTHRNYKQAIYSDVGGFSAEAKLDYFFSELTTISAQLGRTIEDSSVGSISAYFDNRAQLRVDHELLRNLILSVAGEYARQTYIDSASKANSYRTWMEARYLSSRRFGLTANVSYNKRDSKNLGTTSSFNEFRGQVGIVFQR